MADAAADDILGLTAEIVTAHVSYNNVTPDALPSLIRTVHRALVHVDQTPQHTPVKPRPAVPAKESVFKNYVLCLEDGHRFQTLKRHLQTAHGMTPDEYRTKWGLPRDYPIVAPAYAGRRSEVAKQSGLGRRK